MLSKWYARWMYQWETRLTTRDENRVVRPLEWGFDWITPFLQSHGLAEAELRLAQADPEAGGPSDRSSSLGLEASMVRINEILIRNSDQFFGYQRPTDFRLEERHPQLFPTNVRPETLAQDAELKRKAENGKSPARNSFASHRPNARPTRKTTSSTPAGIPLPCTKIPRVLSRPS